MSTPALWHKIPIAHRRDILAAHCQNRPHEITGDFLVADAGCAGLAQAADTSAVLHIPSGLWRPVSLPFEDTAARMRNLKWAQAQSVMEWLHEREADPAQHVSALQKFCISTGQGRVTGKRRREQAEAGATDFNTSTFQRGKGASGSTPDTPQAWPTFHPTQHPRRSRSRRLSLALWRLKFAQPLDADITDPGVTRHLIENIIKWHWQDFLDQLAHHRQAWLNTVEGRARRLSFFRRHGAIPAGWTPPDPRRPATAGRPTAARAARHDKRNLKRWHRRHGAGRYAQWLAHRDANKVPSRLRLAYLNETLALFMRYSQPPPPTITHWQERERIIRQEVATLTANTPPE